MLLQFKLLSGIFHLASFLPNAIVMPMFLDFISDPIGTIKEAIINMIMDFFSSVLNAAYNFVMDITYIPFELSRLPYFNVIQSAFQSISIILAALMLAFRLYRYFHAHLTDGEDTLQAVLSDTIMGVIWVAFFDDFVLKVLLPINEQLCLLLRKLPIDVSLQNGFIVDPTGFMSLALTMILLFVILAICMIIISIQNAIRYVDILFSILLAPFVAAASVNKKELMAKYALDTVSVIFMQPLTILLVYMIMSFAASGSILNMLLAVGATAVSMRGPHTIKNLIYSSGTGSAASGVGKMAMLRMLRR